MASLLDLVPLEIIDMIIDTVAQGDDAKHTNLKTCSMACKTFLPRCRKHIFITIDVTTQNLVGFVTLVDNIPRVAHNIHNMTLTVDLDPLNKISPSAFDHIMHLRVLTICIACGGERIMWMDIQPPIRSALLRLMHLPTLSTLGLCDIVGILPSDVALCLNLSCYVHGAEFQEEDDDNPMTIPSLTTSTSAIKLRKLLLIAGCAQNMVNTLRRGKIIGQPLFDFSELEQVNLYLSCEEQFPNLDQLLEDSHSLETIHLCMERVYSEF